MYEESYSDLLRYVRRRGHPSVVEDVVAETFAIAWKKRRTLPPEPRGWLFLTASNVLKNAHRGQARQLGIAIRSYKPDVGPDLDSDLDLIAAWRALSRIDQEVLALHLWEGLSDREGAQVLRCTRSAYAMRLTRAKHRLANSVRALGLSVTAVTACLRVKEVAS